MAVEDELQPTFTESEFTELMTYLVAEEAPKVFAVVQELGERLDGRIVAWGMAFPEHAEVVSSDGEHRASVREPEGALRLFAGGERVQTRLMWP